MVAKKKEECNWSTLRLFWFLNVMIYLVWKAPNVLAQSLWTDFVWYLNCKTYSSGL